MEKKHINLTAIIAGATLVAGSLGMLTQNVNKLAAQLGTSASERDSLYAEVRQLSRRVAKLEVKAGVKKGKVIRRKDQKREGIGRRVLHLLW